MALIFVRVLLGVVAIPSAIFCALVVFGLLCRFGCQVDVAAVAGGLLGFEVGTTYLRTALRG